MEMTEQDRVNVSFLNSDMLRENLFLYLYCFNIYIFIIYFIILFV